MSPRTDLEPPSLTPARAQRLTPPDAVLARRGLLALTLAFGLGALPGAQAQTPQTQLQRTRLQAGLHLIDAQVALTPEQRSIGLMWRAELAQNEGMLFVFEHAATQCFWMKNTLLPLTAAFIADDGAVVNLANMQPGSEISHCSAKPVRFVLEMQQGWFAKRGIAGGFKLAGAPFQPPRQP